MPGRLTVVAVALVMLALACTGDSSSETRGPQATGSPVATLPPLGQPAVEALGAYLQDTGIDDKKGELTDPIDCAAAEDAGAKGEFCIAVDGGHYALGLAILFVSHRESGSFWQVHVDLNVESSVWEVTSVDPLGRE